MRRIYATMKSVGELDMGRRNYCFSETPRWTSFSLISHSFLERHSSRANFEALTIWNVIKCIKFSEIFFKNWITLQSLKYSPVTFATSSETAKWMVVCAPWFGVYTFQIKLARSGTQFLLMYLHKKGSKKKSEAHQNSKRDQNFRANSSRMKSIYCRATTFKTNSDNYFKKRVKLFKAWIWEKLYPWPSVS